MKFGYPHSWRSRGPALRFRLRLELAAPKEMKTLAATVKEQAWLIQKVSAHLELQKPRQRVVVDQ
jgi:hypothetical protein